MSVKLVCRCKIRVFTGTRTGTSFRSRTRRNSPQQERSAHTQRKHISQPGLRPALRDTCSLGSGYEIVDGSHLYKIAPSRSHPPAHTHRNAYDLRDVPFPIQPAKPQWCPTHHSVRQCTTSIDKVTTTAALAAGATNARLNGVHCMYKRNPHYRR